MKRLFLSLAILWSFSAVAMAQISPCCNGSAVNITNNGNNSFTATNAQAYYWEICSGNATISGSNTSRTVSVNCSGSFTIKVTRFLNGNCYESCRSATCSGSGGGNCPSSNNLYYSNEGAGGLCTTGLASLSGISGVSHVNWTWALGSHSGTINNAGTTTPIYYPSGNWTNYYIVICATVVLNNGTVCPKICKSFLLDCGQGLGGGINRAPAVYPNPSEGSFSIDKGDVKGLSEVIVRNSQGIAIKTITKGLDGEIDLSGQNEGIYFIEMKHEDGATTTQMITIER